MNESSKKKYLVIFGALIIILVASLLFIGNDMERTTNRWFIATIVMGALCGLSFNKKSLAKISGIYLLVISLISVVVIGLTRDYWRNSCFGGLVPPMLILLPPLTALIAYLITALIIFIVKSIVNQTQKKENNQNLEIQE